VALRPVVPTADIIGSQRLHVAVALDLVALSILPVWRWRAISAQLNEGRPPTEVLLGECDDGARRRVKRPRWTDPEWTRTRARQALAQAAQSGLHPIARGDNRYPRQLLEIVDPPPVLWVAGQCGALSCVGVAIVGSRAGSTYALNVAERLGGDLASRGVVVVSGLARGVDSAAHRGALAAGGRTLAVLGSGADVIYPAEHAALAREIAQNGAIVSELVPGTQPRPVFFPRRNRIISGLVRAVVVIEAGEKSGSLITARCALEQGRDVLAVPGSVLGGRNRGGHALLRDGARLVETAADILEELGLAADAGTSSAASAGVADDPVLDALVPGEPFDIGEISARTGLPVTRLLSRLLTLELRGALRREPGGRFVRCDGIVLG
jgi:DNA processing protein